MTEDLIHTIREVFYEDIDDELIKSSLEEANNNVLEAIKIINKSLFFSKSSVKFHKPQESEKKGGTTTNNDDENGDEDRDIERPSILNTLTIEEQLQREQEGLFKGIPTPKTSPTKEYTPKLSQLSEIDSLRRQLEDANRRNKELEGLLEQARSEIEDLKSRISSKHHEKARRPKYPFVLKGRWVQPFVIRYEWKYPESMFPSSKDVIELHAAGKGTDSCVEFSRASGSVEGSGFFNSLDLGVYVLKFVVDGKTIAVSEKIRVGEEVSVSAEMDTTTNTVNVSYGRKNATYTSNDRIVLFCVTSEKLISSKNLTMKSGVANGTISFPLPKLPGKYDVRYYIKKSKAYSGITSFTITNEDTIDVCLIPAQGTTLARVSWKCKAFKRTTSDWVGLYPAGKDASYRCYEYVKVDEEGSVTFDLRAHKFAKGDTVVAKFFAYNYSNSEPVLSKEFVFE